MNDVDVFVNKLPIKPAVARRFRRPQLPYRARALALKTAGSQKIFRAHMRLQYRLQIEFSYINSHTFACKGLLSPEFEPISALLKFFSFAEIAGKSRQRLKNET